MFRQDHPLPGFPRANRRVVSLLIGATLACPALLPGHGPIAPMEIEFVPGRVLVMAREGVELTDGSGGLIPHSPEMASLLSSVGVLEAKALLPHYGSEAMAVLEERAAAGLSTSDPNTRANMDRLGRWTLIQFDQEADVRALAEQLELLPEVEAAEPDYLMRLVDGGQSDSSPGRTAAGWDDEPGDYQLPEFLPNDPDFGLQWGLTYIDAPAAWDLTMGDPSQVIAIIDTGIDLDHPDLASKIWSNLDEAPGDFNGDGCPGICGTDDDGDGLIDEDSEGNQPGDPGYDPAYADDDDENGFIDDFLGWDWISLGEGYEDNDPQDDNGHGTHCAGIAAAATDNSIGGAGACPGCLVMPLKAFQSSGVASFSDIAKATDYAWRNGATVLSMSFSSPANSSLMHDALSLAFSRASLVAAAGNDGRLREVNPYYPAHYSFVLGIEAGRPDGSLEGFSNLHYELRNPGSDIYSSVLDDTYATWSGTSMAAPYVAGTAALLQSFRAGDPAWTPDLVFGQLVQTGGNAFDALTLVPEPDLMFISYEIVDDTCGICDGDGVADAGETVELVVTIRNLWGNATGVNGNLITVDALATVVEGASSWGSVGPAAFDDNADNPFEIDIDPTTGNNRDIVFDLTVNAGNGGSGITTQIVLTVQRGLERGGVLTVNETWTKDNLYLVTSNLLVMPGATLTIEPGTRIQIDAETSILVRGTLIARGTPAERIVFTGNPAGWHTIKFEDESVDAVFDGGGAYVTGSALQFCIFEWAGEHPSTALGAVDLRASPWIADNIFRDLGAWNPLLAQGDAVIERNLFSGNRPADGILLISTPTFRHNTVVGNDSIYMAGVISGPPLSANNLFENTQDFGNTSYDFWMGSSTDLDITGNYWGSVSPTEISDAIYDFFDDVARGVALFEPFLVAPVPLAPPVVANVVLDPPSPVGAERVEFTVTFSKPMNTTLPPQVFFGPADPFTSHPVDLNPTWLDPQTFEVEADVTVFTGDGLQTITVWNAEDLEAFPIPTGDYRFGFEIVTAGTSARRIFATGAAGVVMVDWFASDLPDVAGYNLYRSDLAESSYTKLNSAIITGITYDDFTALPGVTYDYIFRVITTDLQEGPDSDAASGAALDTIAPVVSHSPVSSAPAGLPLTLVADVTDNIAVTGASLFYQASTESAYTELSMINATGDQWTANIPAVDMVPPGVEYYLEATDGVSVTQHGTSGAPHQVTVQNVPVILTVDPTSGPSAGGDVVTITGSNFVDPPIVRFGGEASPSVTYVSSTELEATTPPHFPLLVDVEVENPNATVGTLNHAFTFVGSTATLNLPAAATGDRLSNIQIPVSTPSVGGLLAAVMTVQFDPAILSSTGASTGSLTPGFAMAVNISVPGEITVSMGGVDPVTGAGNIVLLEFQVIGPPAGATALAFESVVLNDGAIPTTLVDGAFTVNNAFEVSGTITYFEILPPEGTPPPVDGVLLDITGSGSYSTNTDLNGDYAFLGLPSGNYNLKPSKSDSHSSSVISPFDASLVFQHSAGIINLEGHAATAADVNKTSGISPVDGSFILQYAAGLMGLPFPGNPEVWTFAPSLYNYPSLDLDQPNQDFTAILVGDPSGNWTPPTEDGEARAAGESPSNPQSPVILRFGDYEADPGGAVIIRLEVENADGLLGALLEVAFNPSVLDAMSVSTTTFSSNFTLVANLATPGRVHLAMAAAEPLTGDGDLVEITFDIVGEGGAHTILSPSGADLNEGALQVALEDGFLQVAGNAVIFMDGFESGDTASWSP